MSSKEGYKKWIANASSAKIRKLFTSYYLGKARTIDMATALEQGNPSETLMRDFLEKGDPKRMEKSDIEILCIIFSDLDPELYDLENDQKVQRLTDIYNQMTISENHRLSSSKESKRGSSFAEAVGISSGVMNLSFDHEDLE